MFSKSVFSKICVLLITFSIISCGSTTGNSSLLGKKSHHIVLNDVEDLYSFLTYDEERFPLVSAHRGGPGVGYPENAIETFEYRIQSQPLIIEFDVRLTKDSVLVLLHDEKLERTTTGKGNLKDYTYKDIQEFYLKDTENNITDFKIPTLDEVLQWGKNKVIFTIDVKRGVPYEMVLNAIEKNKAEPYSIVITYSADQAKEVYSLNPNVMISASIKMAGDLLRLNDRDIPDNRLVAFTGTSEVDRGVYELLHGHGIMCILGTMGNLDRQADVNGYQLYAEFIERGADILSTDRPEEAGKALEFYRNKRNLKSKFTQ